MQKRLAVAGFSVFAALIAAVFLGGIGSFIAGGCTAACLAVFACVKKIDVIKKYALLSAALLAVSLSFFLYGITYALRFAPVMAYADTSAEIRGEILEYPKRQYQKYVYTVGVEAIKLSGGGWAKRSFHIRLSSGKPLVCKPGDRVETAVRLYAFEQGFGLSAQSRYQAQGIALGGSIHGYAVKITTVSAQESPGIFFQSLRRALVQQIRVLFPKAEGAVISAMLLGDETDIDTDTAAAFRQSGTTHLLVVSGMHMALISTLVLWLLGLFSLPKRLKNTAAIFALLLFMLLTGMQTSVVRSGITAILWLLADMLGRETDAMNSLGFAVLVMCVLNPQIGGDAGFLMSVLATLGIITIIPKTERRFALWQKRFPKIKWLKPLYAALCLSLAATAFLLPLQIFMFGKLPLAAPLATVLLTLPAAALIYFSALALLFSGLWFLSPFMAPLVLLAGICAKICGAVAVFFAGLPIVQLDVSGDYGMLALGGGMALAGIAVFIEAGRKTKLAAGCLCVLVLVCALGLEQQRMWDVLTVAVADAGEDSTVVLLQNREAAVLSLSGYNTGLPLEILQENNVKRVKSLCLLQDDAATQEAALKILGKYRPETIYLAENAYLDRPLREKLAGCNIIPVGEQAQHTLLLPGVSAGLLEAGGLLLESESGQRILLERDGEEARRADLLITANSRTKADSPFTVLQTNAILLEDAVKAGRYVLTAHRRITYIDIQTGGTYALRGDS